MSDDITRRAFIGTAAVIVLAPVADATSEQTVGTRRTLRAAVDCIIPARAKMPGASSVGAVEYLESVSARDQEIREKLSKTMTALGPTFADTSETDQVSALEKLEKADPTSFATLRDVVYEAYYTNPKIWALIGYPFHKGNRKTAALEDFDTNLLARVQQLPRLYRESD